MLDLLWQRTYFDTGLTLTLDLTLDYSFKKWLTLTLDLLWYWTLRNGRPVLWLWRKSTCPGSVNLSRHPPIANSGHQNLRETESKLLTFNAWIRGQDLQILCSKCQIFIILWIYTFFQKLVYSQWNQSWHPLMFLWIHSRDTLSSFCIQM